ncbi:MAG: lycopene cyclase family protein [Bacteroidota bacterium]
MSQYDYIIIGAGAAGLMLADAMGKDSFFKDRTVLLLDGDNKKNNDRTWCFWEQDPGPFDDILHRTWNHIYFGGQRFSNRFSITPYTYKMVRGIDFYKTFLKRLGTYPNIIFAQEWVTDTEDQGHQVLVTTKRKNYTAKTVFNSIFDYKMVIGQKCHPVLQQHFIGWFVKTKKPVFTTDQVTFMDFSVPQKGNTRFMYVLPMSPTYALVEYTLFSEKTLPEAEYERAILDYISTYFKTTDFEILDKEKGSIPMTCYDFAQHNSKNMFHIGTAGGWAKPSTGYTFKSTAKKIPKLIAHLKSGKNLKKFKTKNRFWYYDLLLLDILYRDNAKGHHIFETMFKNIDPQKILKFLDEDTHFLEDLKVMHSAPSSDFFKALVRRMF